MATYHYHPERKKATVEDCLSVDANDLVHLKLMQPGRRSTTIWWSYGNSSKNVAGCWVQVTIMDEAYVEFGYNEKIIKVMLSGYTPGFGGCRYFFLCPVCGRRMRTLHFKGDKIACRLCHNLTYRSCQEGHEFDSLFKRLADGERFSWHYVKRFINYCIRENAKRPRRPRGRPLKVLSPDDTLLRQ